MDNRLETQRRGSNDMWRLIKAMIYLVILSGLALVIYAYVGPIFFPDDFAAPQQDISDPIVLEPLE